MTSQVHAKLFDAKLGDGCQSRDSMATARQDVARLLTMCDEGSTPCCSFALV